MNCDNHCVYTRDDEEISRRWCFRSGGENQAQCLPASAVKAGIYLAINAYATEASEKRRLEVVWYGAEVKYILFLK